MRRFERLTSKVVALPLDNINTDQIIPARFLKRSDTDGWGSSLFADCRRNPQFVLNSAHAAGAAILLAGSNFGCGSSREHAAWALRDFGFQVIVAPSFADIFKENAIKNGLLPAIVAQPAHAELAARLALNPTEVWTVDLAKQVVGVVDTIVPFEIDRFAKTCLLQGLDELGYILDYEYAITTHEVFTST